MTKRIQDQIAELEGSVRGFENEIRVIRTDMTNDTLFEQSIKSHRERIAWHQRMIDNMVARREHGPERIEAANKSIAAAKKKIKLLRMNSQIEKLRELERQIAEIAGADEQCQVHLQYGDKRRRCEGTATTTVLFHGKRVLACEDCRKAYEERGTEFFVRRSL